MNSPLAILADNSARCLLLIPSSPESELLPFEEEHTITDELNLLRVLEHRNQEEEEVVVVEGLSLFMHICLW